MKVTLKKLKRYIMWPLAIVALVVIIITGLLYNIQEKLIFFPEKLSADHQFQFEPGWEFEEMNFGVEKGVSLNGLLFRSEQKKGLVIYYHGNAGSLSSWGYVQEPFTKLGYDILIIDYRGYGKSTGSISSEKQLHNDASFVYQEMIKTYKEEETILYGRSIGTAIAAKLAADNSPKKLLLESPYFNFNDLVKQHYSSILAVLVKYKLATNTYLLAANCPVLLVHGTIDNIIPFQASERLAALSENIELTAVTNGGHNDLIEFEIFHNWLRIALED